MKHNVKQLNCDWTFSYVALIILSIFFLIIINFNLEHYYPIRSEKTWCTNIWKELFKRFIIIIMFYDCKFRTRLNHVQAIFFKTLGSNQISVLKNMKLVFCVLSIWIESLSIWGPSHVHFQWTYWCKYLCTLIWIHI